MFSESESQSKQDMEEFAALLKPRMDDLAEDFDLREKIENILQWLGEWGPHEALLDLISREDSNGSTSCEDVQGVLVPFLRKYLAEAVVQRALAVFREWNITSLPRFTLLRATEYVLRTYCGDPWYLSFRFPSESDAENISNNKADRFRLPFPMPLIAPTYIPGTYPSVNNPIENAALTFQESWACLRADRPPPFDPDSTSSVPPTTLLFHATRRHHLACMRTNDSFSILDNSSRHDLTAAGTSGVYLLNSFANAVAQVLRYQHAPSTVDDTVAVIVFEVETDVLLRKEVAKKLGAKFKTKVFDVPTAPEEVGYAEKYQEFCEFVGANWDPYSGWTKAGWTEEEDNDFLVAPLSLTPLKTDVGMDVNLNPDGPRLVQVAPRSYMAKQYLKEWMTEIVVERRTTEP